MDTGTRGALEEAAARHLMDGLCLSCANAQHWTGAVYLLGYVIELRLKTAYYRFLGLDALDQVAVAFGGLLRFLHGYAGIGVRNAHNLRALAEALIDERGRVGRTMDPIVAGELRWRTARLTRSYWSERLRYTGESAREAEVGQIFRDVEWIESRFDQLWR